MNIDPNWDLETAFYEISSRYRPGSYFHGRTRNLLLQTWGEIVGRNRAKAELAALIEKSGSRNKFRQQYSISEGPLAELETHFDTLPPDPEPEPDKRKSGDHVGPWTLLARLGRGGGAEVWKAVAETHGQAALKIPWGGKSHKERFAAERDIMTKLNGTKGVMPLVAVSDVDAAIHWIAMPIAAPVASAPDQDDPNVVLKGIAQVCETLSGLHEKGVSHRDIKPDNLYVLDGIWVLSDFGIASFPGKKALTKDNKKLGPMYFIAPEMLMSPSTADGSPADVYSLAKTLWVLLSGQKYPPPGEQRIAVESLRISSYVAMKHGPKLDELLDECTRHDPKERPKAAEMGERVKAVFE